MRCMSAGSPATRVPASRRARRGTYAGLIEKIPYLQDLGITAVELLPVFAFDEQDGPPGLEQLLGLPAALVLRAASRLQLAPRPARRRSTSFATWSRRCTAPASRSSSTSSTTTPPRATQTGPTLCFRGLANETYYILEPTTSRATPTTPAAATR